MTITASAPGKVVLVGEYAVLEGAPALVMAVNRRVSVTLVPRHDGRCAVSAPGWSDAGGRFELTAAGPDWLDCGARTFSLADHVLKAFCRAETAPMRAFDLVMDSAALMERRPSGIVKLGLGSSAALTVALWQALSYHVAMQQAPPTPDLAGLIDIHAGFQDRRGSGADVAASLHGGVIEFTRSPSPHVRAARLPDGLAYCFVWSGQQARTGSFLARIDRWRELSPDQHAAALAPLLQIARNAQASARANDREAFLELVEEYVPALETLGTGAGADILSKPHRRLRAIARRCDIVYKPCGAGGGDIGIGLSRDPEALARFQSSVAAEGFLPLSLDVDRSGVRAQTGN